MSYTTADLVASIKRRASVPTSQNLFSFEDFIALANDELSSDLVPLIMSVREEYFVANYDYTCVAGQSLYEIPTRAIGGKLRDIQLIDSSGSIRSLPRLFEEDRTSDASNDQNFGFYIVGNFIQISPEPRDASETLRMVHYRRPGVLVSTSECAQITSIDSQNFQVVVSSAPSGFGTGILVDFVKQKAGFENLAVDSAITSVSGTTIGFTVLPQRLAVGDWIAIAGESPIPQVPEELQSLLAQMVACKCLEAMGDNKLQASEVKLGTMRKAALTTISPRVDGANKKIRNRHGLLNHFRMGR